MATQDQTPSWLRDYEKPTKAAPNLGEQKTKAGVAQSEASAASSAATANRTTALTPGEVAVQQLTIEEKQRKADEEKAAKIALEEANRVAAERNRDQVRGLLEDIQRARKLLTDPMATGPAAQLTGGIWSTPAYNLSSLLAGIKNPIVMDAMKAARAGSKVGATGFGALSNKELDLLASALGSLREGQSPKQLLETLNRIDTYTRRFMAYNAGYDPNKPEGAMLVGLPMPKGVKEPPLPSSGEIAKGKWTKNPELAGVDAAVTSMIKGGRSAAEIQQWLNEYQPGLGDRTQNLQTNIDYWRQSKKDPRVLIERQFVPDETKTSLFGPGAGSAYAAGAADQILLGGVDELSGNREQTAAVMRGLEELHPFAYPAGQVTGSLLTALVPEGLLTKYGVRAGGSLLEGVAQNAAYGFGSAEPGERASSAFYEGLMTPFTNFLGNTFGKVVGMPFSGASPRMRVLKEKYGIDLTPGQMTDGGGAEQTLSAMPIVGNQIRARRNETLDQFNVAAFDEGLKPINVRVSAPGQAGIAEAQSAVSKAYTDALGDVLLRPDTAFAQQVRGKAYNDLSKLRDVGPELQKEIDDIFIRHADESGAITGENLQNALTDIQKLKNDYKTDTRWRTRIAPQLDEISDAYSGLLERQFPENFKMFQSANQAYRNVSILEKAVDSVPDGDVFSPGILRRATKEGTIRFGGKKASARGDRPFNTLVMASLKTIPSKYDDASLAGRIATPVLAGGAGLTYGGVSLMAQPERANEQGGGEETGVLPAPLAYGLGLSALASLPYSRVGSRAMSSLISGPRSRGQQTLGDLIQRYSPATFRGLERGFTSEPGIPSPQEAVPLIDAQTQALIDKTAFAEPPKEEEGLVDAKSGRVVVKDKDTGKLIYADTGEEAESAGFAYGGLVFAPRGY